MAASKSEEAAADNAVTEEVAQEAAPESMSAFASLPPPPKRAVHFVEPFVVRAGQTLVLTVRHDGHRLAVASPMVPSHIAGTCATNDPVKSHHAS